MDQIVTILKKATDLPVEWDSLCTEYFQTREFLFHAEKYNYCNQRYYLLFEDTRLSAGAVVYSLRLDLLTYLRVKSPFTMHIAGIPCSVSSGGFTGEGKLFPELAAEIRKQEKGMLLMLNLEDQIQADGFVAGRTLPTLLFTKELQSWSEYLIKIRTDYRRRLHRISATFARAEKTELPCSEFTSEMHSQYLEVFKRSKGKLETLSAEFFRFLPPGFVLTAYKSGTRLLGWKITLPFKEKYYFFLAGVDYSLNGQFNTYFNILTDVLKEGIARKAEVIDFGQTAEIPKMRLGCRRSEKMMLAYHSNPVLRKFLRTGKKILEYSFIPPETHVFKNGL